MELLELRMRAIVFIVLEVLGVCRLCSHWLRCWFFDIGFFTLWSELIGLLCVVWRCFTTSGWRTFEKTLRLVFFACVLSARPSHAVSPRPEVIKLLALSNFRHMFTIRVSQDITEGVVLCFLILYVLPSIWSNAPLITGILSPMTSLTLLHAPLMTRIRNGSLVSDALFRGFLCFSNLFD